MPVNATSKQLESIDVHVHACLELPTPGLKSQPQSEPSGCVSACSISVQVHKKKLSCFGSVVSRLHFLLISTSFNITVSYGFMSLFFDSFRFLIKNMLIDSCLNHLRTKISKNLQNLLCVTAVKSLCHVQLASSSCTFLANQLSPSTPCRQRSNSFSATCC